MTLDIYKSFSSCRDYSFRDQIQRASISIMNNVAEGYARRSDQALANFLSIARGSAAEVESMIILAAKLGYLDKQSADKLLNQAEETSKILSGFINKIKAAG